MLFTEDFPPDFIGGVAAWAHDLALSPRDDVHVFARSSKYAKEHDHNFPVPITRMRGRNWGKHKALWTWFSAKKTNPDVAIFAHWQLARFAAKALKKRGVKVWAYAHGSDLHPHRINRSHLRKTANSIDVWLPVSNSLKARLHSMLPHVNAVVPPMPLQIPEAPPPPTPNGPLMVISRLVKSKNIPQAIDLAQQLNKELIIVGDGPDRERLENYALDKPVRFVGRQSRQVCLSFIETASCVVLMSTVNDEQIGDEGLGLCLLEAASRGKGCIGSRSGGIPEAIGAGIVLPPKVENHHIKHIIERLNDENWGIECYKWVSKSWISTVCRF